MGRLTLASGEFAVATHTRVMPRTLVDGPEPLHAVPAERSLHPAALTPGCVLARRYRILACIGRGGMATVYRARQLSLGREVAVKVLHRAPSELGLARFYAEASLTAQIRHTNVVDILDLDVTETGAPFIVMELLQGEDLYARLSREGPMSWKMVRSLLLQICEGLGAAHRAGVVHRDLKPANCFYSYGHEGEVIKLLDFGVAQATKTSSQERLTIDEHVVGTPEYMAPEQAKGESVDARADIYALGIILGELLTGKVPFEAKTPQAVIAAHIYKEAPSLDELAAPEIPRGPAFDGLAAIYARALSKDPAARYESIADMAEAIAAVGERPQLPGAIARLIGHS